jgi:hypothetical protein
MKFKLGDEVIVLGNPTATGFYRSGEDYPYNPGYKFKIGQRCIEYNNSITPIANTPDWIFYFEDSDTKYTVTEDKLELVEVYESPLYKMLKEE